MLSGQNGRKPRDVRKVRMAQLTIVIEPLPRLDQLASLWRDFDRMGAHDFFVTWTWLGTWLQALPNSVRPQLVKAMRGDVVVGLATVSLTSSRLHGLVPISQAWLNASGNSDIDQLTIEHNGFASAQVSREQLMQGLIRTFAEGQISADELVLPGIAGVIPGRKLIDVGKLVPAFGTRLDKLDSSQGIEPLLSPNARQQLRRSLRQAQRVGPIKVEVAPNLSTALQFFEQMKILHIHWWERRGRRHAFSHSFFEKFHLELVANGMRDKNIDLLRVSAGDHVIGYLYNFRRNGKISSYQTGFDESIPNLRPGYICHALAMKHYADEGMLYYDFLAGSNRLKQSFSSERYELGWHHLRRKTTLFQIDATARRIGSALKERLNQNSGG
jgi:CelD/BcsL family acetyltransferase involved in cellulose biosynthesis